MWQGYETESRTGIAGNGLGIGRAGSARSVDTGYHMDDAFVSWI